MNGRWFEKGMIGGTIASVPGFARLGGAAANAVGDTGDGGSGAASVVIDGGTVTSTTSLSISADGGTAIADASGGDSNFAFAS